MAERLLVRDLMVVGVETCRPGTPIIDIVRLLLKKNLESIVVLDAAGHGSGVVSQDDLVAAYSRDDTAELKAEDIMCDEVPQVPPEIPLKAAAQIMQDQGVRQVFVVHHADGVIYPAASLSYNQLLRHLAANDEDNLVDLGTHATREAPLETFVRKRDQARRQASVIDEE
jgi:CBS domain-containing protein